MPLRCKTLPMALTGPALALPRRRAVRCVPGEPQRSRGEAAP